MTHAEHGAERDPNLYVQAAGFRRQRAAGRAYLTILRAIKPADLAVFKFPYEGLHHVIVVGARPTSEIDTKIRNALVIGGPHSITPDMISELAEIRDTGLASHKPLA